jgi:dipeptidyl aminopeptidase/acylaminoacyl peptidase
MTTELGAPLIPREVLFGNPTRVSPRISPDGQRLAWIAPDEGVLNIWVKTIGSDDDQVITNDRDRGIRAFFWAPDNRRILYIQDQGGDENWRLHDVLLESTTTRDLTPFENVAVRVEEVNKRHPDRILVGINKDNEQLHDLYSLSLESGELEKVAENPGFLGFIVDDDLVARGAAAPTPDGGMVVLIRDTPDDEWRPLFEVGQEDALTTEPLSFSLDGSRLLCISSKDANAARLVWVDCKTGAFDVLAADETYDVSHAHVHPDTREVQAVAFLRDRIEWQVLDEGVRADFDAIAALDDGDFVFQGRDHADRTWLVAFDRDDGPVRYYAFDRDNKEGTFLFEHRPELNDYTLAPLEPIEITSRDGLTIHGYLTFPPGGARTGLPTVLNVHGGPWARDASGYNPEAQWFANRGYLCVQVNFRGSTGYGKDFINAGDREWGAKMHDDLIDAVEWVIDKGYADRERIAIYGGSYGGYAALVGATFTPDVFRCAVDIVGPSNLKTLIESIPPYWAPMIKQFHTRVGDPETDEEFMWSRSPLSKVDEIKIPLLIAQGANDPRVKQAESEQIVAAMKEKGIPHEYVLFPDEGHGFAKPENRMRFYAIAERFLAEHLGGRAEAG